MVPPVPPKKSAALPILGWISIAALVIAAGVLLVTVIRSTSKRQELRTVDVKRLYAHCKLVREALSDDARDLMIPDAKDAAVARFGVAPLHSVLEIQLCSRKEVDTSAQPRCAQAKDYGCLEFIAREARDAVTATLKNDP